MRTSVNNLKKYTLVQAMMKGMPSCAAPPHSKLKLIHLQAWMQGKPSKVHFKANAQADPCDSAVLKSKHQILHAHRFNAPHSHCTSESCLYSYFVQSCHVPSIRTLFWPNHCTSMVTFCELGPSVHPIATVRQNQRCCRFYSMSMPSSRISSILVLCLLASCTSFIDLYSLSASALDGAVSGGM